MKEKLESEWLIQSHLLSTSWKMEGECLVPSQVIFVAFAQTVHSMFTCPKFREAVKHLDLRQHHLSPEAHEKN